MGSKYTVDEICERHIVSEEEAVALLALAADDQTVDNVLWLMDEGYPWSYLQEYVMAGDDLGDLVLLRRTPARILDAEWQWATYQRYRPRMTIDEVVLNRPVERGDAVYREDVVRQGIVKRKVVMWWHIWRNRARNWWERRRGKAGNNVVIFWDDKKIN